MNTESKEEVILRKCSKCGCKKLLKFFKVRESTGAVYKTCITCCGKNKKCHCGVRPYFGYPTDKSATCCAKCKKDDMVNIKDKRCPCGTQPIFGYPNDKSATCCFKCKKDDMIDIKNKKCKTSLCDTQACTKRYRGYCSRCFFFTFPDEKLSRNYKTKENLVTNYIKNKFPQYDWVADKRIKYGCSLKRPDMYCDFGSHIVVQETDESCHTGYSCENKRMMEISKDFGHRPCIFIRFNPDKYTNSIGKNVPSCFVVKKDTGKLEVKNIKNWKNRLECLSDTIAKYGDTFVTDKTITVEQLFYN